MKVARDRGALVEALATLRSNGTVALVPTMGYLHDGHLSLVDRARDQADSVVVSIFVNPLQFGAGEDLESYPRDEERDLELLRLRGVDVVFAPTESGMYPDGTPVVTVAPGRLAHRLCGAFRPGHFRGVLTVVARLFGLVRPDVAVFGQKDYQQVTLIRRMVRDLDMGPDIVTAPIVREPDGLAMSSRNAYLTADERTNAVGLSRALDAAAAAVADGTADASQLIERARGVLRGYPLLEAQYIELVDPDTLEPVETARPGDVLALAVFCGTTRLIDNRVL